MALNGYRALENATKKAFDKMAAVPKDAGKTWETTDVEFYDALTPEAFDVIAATYGPENLIRYVQTMESKRMNRGQNGN